MPFNIRILIIIFVIGYVVWFVNTRILGRNLALAKVIASTLVITSLLYVFLAILSYVIEGTY